MKPASGIVVIVSGFPRRSETFALGELDALSRAGLLLAAFATKPGDGGPAHADATRLAPYVRWLAPGDPASQAAEVASVLDGRGAQGVHGYFAHTPADVAQRAAARLRIPFGFSVHAKDVRKVTAGELRDRAARASLVVTCNDDARESLHALGIDARLVPHGVNLARFVATPNIAACPAHLLAVGRLVPKKGFDVLLRALARTRGGCAVSIVGDGPERERLTSLAAELGVADRVTWVGAVTHDHLPAHYREAGAVVVPSVVDESGDRDGLPNVVLEAMASGRLLIASRVGAIEAAVRHDETGWLVSPGDPQALADRLDAVVAMPEQVARLAANGRSCVERHYEIGACSRRFVDVLASAYA